MKILLINYSIIKNGFLKKFSSVFLYKSNLTLSFLDVLFREGVIRYYKILPKQKIEVFLKYHKGVSVISDISSITTGGRSIFYRVEEISCWKNLRSPLNSFLIINSSKGIFSSNEIHNYKIGGQILCLIK